MDWTRVIFCSSILIIVILSYCDAQECESDLDFMCASDKKCIDSSLMCDHKFDCDDHSDEENCECLEPDWYLCKDQKTCISHSARCDGQYDCPTEDDEDKCEDYVAHHEVTNCTKDEFKCTSDGACIPLEIVCDGTKHCFDGSDEVLGCKEINSRCQGFHCSNGQCLTDLAWVCDGVNDCGDNSDEQKCTYDCNLQNNKFLCGNNETCIPLEKVCDGTKDCSSGDDESDECVKQKKKKICSKSCTPNGHCVNLPTGQTCACPKGFKFNEKRGECEDINECLEFGMCSQGCVNSLGSYKCTCAPNFRLMKNNHTCRAYGIDDAILLYSASKTVNWFSLKSKHMKRVAENLNQVIGVSYDGHHVYWTDISQQVESIMKASKNGSDVETLFTAGLSKPEDIAVDYVTGNLYFTDNDHQHVAVCSNDGRYCKAIITGNVDRPRGIALHPQKGKMYWSDWGMNPMIAVASMDGNFNRPLVNKDITWPNGLTLDWPNERLYWVDARPQTIESCKLDGSDRRIVIKEISKHPYGIAVFEDLLYWSDWDSKSIQSCNKFTGKNRTTIIRDSVIYDIHVYHSSLQASTKNACENSGCSHLCLLNSNSSYTCDCPKYMELTVDKHTCRWTGKQQILLIGTEHRLVKFEHQSFGRHEDAEDKELSYHIHSMAYNTITGDAIIADNMRKVVVQVNLKNYNTKEIITQNIGWIVAMSYDELANNLYWADVMRSSIEVYSFTTQHRTVVRHFMGESLPIALVAITEVGKLFVALRSQNHTHIDVIAPNGRGAQFHVIEEDLGNELIAMVKDPNLKEVFWVDSENSKIAYTDYNGELHHTFLHDVNNPVSMAVLDDDLFWSTSRSTKLNWTPKHSFSGTKSMHVEHPLSSATPVRMQLLAITTPTVSSHPCAQHGFNGGCSHICVAMSTTSHSCLCTPGTLFRDAQNTTCVPYEDCYFRCGSGECITEAERCNGVKNCQDSSDEEGCKEKKIFVTCAPNEFTCLDGKKCIDRKLRCDQHYDCDDSSDEKDCKDYNRETQCHENQFLCLNGHCIDSNQLCDGFKDCEKGEDEIDTYCRSESRTCNTKEFKCSNNDCIPKDWVCDGSLDCSNDEENCPPVKCSADMKQCDHGMCVSKELWCNGVNDCGDFSDESDCETWHKKEQVEIVCGDGETEMFQCKNNKTICLEMSKRCDGHADCPKGEDELNCNRCNDLEFTCGPGECIPLKWRCDKQKDCKDGSDEVKCDNVTSSYSVNHYTHPYCSDLEFRCKNGKECIDWDHVCDTDHDCSDGSDEGENCETACKDSPCDQTCIRSPNGPVCECHDGYTLKSDKKTCIDINECAATHPPCAQKCENTKGSYQCSCNSGFALSTDKISCKSTDKPMFMFYSSFDTIYRVEKNFLTSVKSTNDSKIVGLDMHFDKQLLYFTIEDSGALYEFNFTQNGAPVNTVKNIGMPTHVAVDWITDNVYFIDDSVAIKVCHMENRKCITLDTFKQGEFVKSLAVDALNHRLFYVTVKKFEFNMPESKIIARRLDGSQKKMISIDAFYVPSITCDIYTERVYYVGLETKSIWSVRYDGTGKQLVTASMFITRPIEITLFEGHAYVSNAGSKKIAKCQLYGERRCKPYELNVNQADNLVIAQKSRQISAENVCANNKCSAICTPSDVGAKCICDFGQSVGHGVECMTELQNKPDFYHNEPAEESGSTAKMILGTLAAIALLIALAAGGLYVYKRFYPKRNHTISMHFENPRSETEAARVKMCKLNEIMIHRHNNNNNEHRGNVPSSTMIEEQEITDLSTPTTSDDTQRLLF